MLTRFPVRWLALAGACLSACSIEPTATAPTEATPPASFAVAPNACGSGGASHPGKILDQVTAPSPWGVAVRDDGLSYFTNLFGNEIGIASTKSKAVIGSIPTGAFPTGIAFSPDGLRAYSANQGDNTVGVIDVTASRQIASIQTGGASPFSVQVSPDGTQLYVGNNDNTLLVVDAETLQILKTVQVGFATNAFAVDGAGRMLYASSFASGTVSEIDIFTGNVLRTFSLGGTTQGLGLNKKGTHLYVANEGGYLSDVDLMTGQIGNPISIAGVGFGLGVTPDDNEAWITLPLDGKVQVFNLKQRRITGTLNVGGQPRRVAFSQQGKIGAVTNFAGYLTFVR